MNAMQNPVLLMIGRVVGLISPFRSAAGPENAQSSAASMKELRLARGWTQARLAGELYLSRQTIYAIESGRFDPSLPLAFATARCFELRIEEIFTPGEIAAE